MYTVIHTLGLSVTMVTNHTTHRSLSFSHYFLNLLLESIASPVQIPNYLDLDSEVNILDYIGTEIMNRVV